MNVVVFQPRLKSDVLRLKLVSSVRGVRVIAVDETGERTLDSAMIEITSSGVARLSGFGGHGMLTDDKGHVHDTTHC